MIKTPSAFDGVHRVHPNRPIGEMTTKNGHRGSNTPISVVYVLYYVYDVYDDYIVLSTQIKQEISRGVLSTLSR